MSYCHCPLKKAAQECPSALALVGENISLTYRQLDELAFERGKEELIVSEYLPPSEMIPLLFATWRRGASICLLSSRLPQKKREQYRKEIHSHFPIPQSLLLFTSGSSGIPKIAILSLRSLLMNAAHSIPLQKEDRYHLSLPLFHVGGIGILLRSILARATITLHPEDPKTTHISYVPTQLYRKSPVHPNLKCILLGGAPIHSISSQLPIWGTYGLTEMGSMVLTKQSPTKHHGKFFLGEALQKREVRLGKGDEIFVRGETLFSGYLQNGEILKPMKEGWFPTGDIGKYDANLGFAIVGRKDWQFISGGENIQPEEIEIALLALPEILEAVVIPQKDPEFGMRPIALIHSTNPHLKIDEIKKKLLDTLPKYKIPIKLYHSKNIPKTGNKIDRKQVEHNLLTTR